MTAGEAEGNMRLRNRRDNRMKYVLVLIGIPLICYGFSRWIDFWINRSLGQWMACGCGIPLAFIVAVGIWAKE